MTVGSCIILTRDFDFKLSYLKMSIIKCLAGLAHSLGSKPSIKAFGGTSKFFSDWLPVEKITHTGQSWAEDDYRQVRFVDRPKHVNPNFAIDLVEQEPPTVSKSRVVSCDGGGGPIGHPKVYINLDKPGSHSCGYCGLRFTLEREDH